MERTLYLKSFTFNSVTYQGGGSGTGGPIRCRWNDGSESVVKDRTGADLYPTAIFLTDKDNTVTISMRDIHVGIVAGTKGNLVGTYSDGSADIKVITFANVVYTSTSVTQDRATPGEADYIFVHESSDGTTVPVTEAS